MNRRQLLVGSGATLSAVLAGCASDTAETGNGSGNGQSELNDGKGPLEAHGWMGTGSLHKNFVSIGSGLTVIDATYEGDDFLVHLYQVEGEDSYRLETASEYDGASATLLDGGDYTLAVNGNGAQWSVEIRHPRADHGESPHTIFDDGPVVAGPFEFDDSEVARISHPHPSTFAATIYPTDGDSGEQLSTNLNGDSEVQFDFDGVGWVDVRAANPWEISFE